MILIECTPNTRPADFLMVAQNPTTYALLGFSATGTEYAGDFSGYQARFGTSNELGDYTGDLFNPTYVPPTNASVIAKFNANQDKLRLAAYREEADALLAEAWRHEIDPSSNASKRQERKQAALTAVNAVKARFPKIS